MTTPENGMAFRPFTSGDIKDGLRLCRIAGWNQMQADWELFYALNPAGCFVTMAEDTVTGTVTTIDYSGKTSWIAMVLVDPDFRRRGIGTMLLNGAIESLAHCDCIKLDATPAGKKVYDRLGFRDSFTLGRYICESVPVQPAAGSSLRQMTSDDFAAVVKLDGNAFGIERPEVIEGFFRLAPEYAFVSDTGAVTGFVLGRHGVNFEQLGPIVADNEETARQLVSAALQSISGKKAGIDARGAPSWLNWLTETGFAEERPFIRMVRGDDPCPENLENLFAISGPELG